MVEFHGKKVNNFVCVGTVRSSSIDWLVKMESSEILTNYNLRYYIGERSEGPRRRH